MRPVSALPRAAAPEPKTSKTGSARSRTSSRAAHTPRRRAPRRRPPRSRSRSRPRRLRPWMLRRGRRGRRRAREGVSPGADTAAPCGTFFQAPTVGTHYPVNIATVYASEKIRFTTYPDTVVYTVYTVYVNVRVPGPGPGTVQYCKPGSRRYKVVIL